MSKPWKKARKDTTVIRPKGLCDFANCTRRAKQVHECLTCEKLKEKPVFSMRGCSLHTAWALRAVRIHALRKHPANILGACAAALKGEDVFD